MRDDLISRKALDKALEDTSIVFPKDKAKMFELIKEAPSVDAEPVMHGEWIFLPPDLGVESGYLCSICRSTRWHSPDVPQAFRRCPNCGAKMR